MCYSCATQLLLNPSISLRITMQKYDLTIAVYE